MRERLIIGFTGQLLAVVATLFLLHNALARNVTDARRAVVDQGHLVAMARVNAGVLGVLHAADDEHAPDRDQALADALDYLDIAANAAPAPSSPIT